MNRLSLTTIAAALLLAGCASMAPKYEQPAMPVAAGWPTGPAYEASVETAAPMAFDIDWKQFIVDEDLRELVAIALENNRDLRVAALNIERARALYQIQRADSFPSIGISGAGRANVCLPTLPLAVKPVSAASTVPVWE